VADVDNRRGWRDVEILWELKKNNKEINSREHIGALALKAAEIMRVQWARKFVIVVFACGLLWRLCWFDRAGGVTHTHFDIESNPEWFACSVLFPLLLPKSELGVAESLSTTKVGDQEFILGDTLFRPRTDHLISRGTFVRKARRPNDDENNWPLCVKLSWRSEG
jgi:Fungal protein kinase